MTQWRRKLLRALWNRDPSYCDMYEDAHARAVATEYLTPIRRHLREQFGARRLSMLDAGCQSGRVLIPLAQAGHAMIGLDASAFALRRARAHARAQRLTVRLIRSDIANLRRWVAPASLDAVICTEVLYLCRNYRTVLQRFTEVLKPGGLLFVSHRPTLYYVALAVAHGHFEQAAALLAQGEGHSTDGAYHNWQTPAQLAALYRSLHLTWIDGYPIDCSATRLDLAHASDKVRRFFASARTGDSTFRIPTYLLVVAQHGVRVAADNGLTRRSQTRMLNI